MNIVLFGGSFNPIHNGHLALAKHFAQKSNIDEVWLLLSPQNPLKQLKMASDRHRLEMLQLATENIPKLKICDIELSLPKPNYTYETLQALKKMYPQHTFSLLIGEDNLVVFNKWKNYERILNEHQIYVYPRQNEDKKSFIQHRNINFISAPLFPISSTEIREKIAKKEDVEHFLPAKIHEFISSHKIY